MRLSRAFVQTGRPLRNVGAFFATLCRDIPEASGGVQAVDVLERLRNPAKPMRWYIVTFHDTFDPSEYPPIGPDAFEEGIRKKLDGYSEEEILLWLRHGRGPIKEAAKRLVEALPPPRTLSGALAALLERPRLAGARAYLTQMLSAMALPPRQRLMPDIPLGGYADVTSRGHPHMLLLSQFALDELDFLRRFADNELLYYRREEPHAHTRHELIVLLDQGVRTWGDVRLVLSAAALALGKLAARAKMPCMLAGTSTEGEALDPLAVSDDILGTMVEASDLSANPGLALERILEQPAVGSRDVVLLTHPRNLLEEDVRAAAMRAAGETRLMALSLDGGGQAALSELRHGAPIVVRQFRVDFNPSPVMPAPKAVGQPPAQWYGDVEPIGFPFRFGSNHPIGANLFDFDFEGRWLLTASRDGVLHIWATDGSGHYSLLPRAYVDGQPLVQVQSVLGVTGGFVVAGRRDDSLVVVHYDLASATCTARIPCVASERCDWSYSPRHHVVICQSPTGRSAFAFDLGTHLLFPDGTGRMAGRAREAWHEMAQGKLPVGKLPCLPPKAAQHCELSCITVTPSGTLILVRQPPSWKPFTPLANGQPALLDCKLLDAECRASILAVLARGPGSSGPVTLRLFHWP